MSLAWQNRILMVMLAIALAVIVAPAFAQSPSCTTLGLGQTQDITAFSVCKRVTLASVPGPDAVSICVPTNIDAAQWASFYNNPPPGVTVEECISGPCGAGGYYQSATGYCYYWAGDLVTASCDTVCASRGGCNLPGTRAIGTDSQPTFAAACLDAANGLTGGGSSSVSGSSPAGLYDGCFVNTLKGGWVIGDYFTANTTCAAANVSGRVCACNLGSRCALPWGGYIVSGTGVTAYASATGTPTCTSQTRTCTNASLSGSYTAQSCTPGCALPWGGYIANGASVTAFQAATGSPTCTSQTRTCTAGTLSGTYINQTCAAGCNLPWGGYIASGASVTAFQAAAGTPTCTSQSRTCTNGTLSGSYANQSCTAGCALPWGGYIASGASVTAYQVASHANCASVDETRTCSNGTLSGSFTNQSCSAPAACGGYSYNGYCYYSVGPTQSCDTYCSTRGGCNAAGTQSANNSARCAHLADYFGWTVDYPTPGTISGTKGCHNMRTVYDPTPTFRGDEEIYWDLYITSGTASCSVAPGAGQAMQRTCACNN